MVERGGFEPPKALASRFTVCPVKPLRYLSTRKIRKSNTEIRNTSVSRFEFRVSNFPAFAGWSGRWESNPPHQLGRLAHYHYATPASNAPPSYTSNRLSVKSKPRWPLAMRPMRNLTARGTAP